jgi:glycosyltransferase involved in cell wall biosynthesis
MAAAPLRVMVAMPAYNEEKYIGGVVLLARRHAGEVVVVDDGSRDRTARIAEMAGAAVVRHDGNRGYGATIQSIFAEARQRDPDVLVIIDADAQHDPDEIPALVAAVREGADVVIGSREMRRNATPAYRRMGQRFLTYLTSLASRQKMTDTESGFRAYSRKAVRELELNEEGMAISSEIVSAAAGKGLKIAEVPISVSYAADSSTLNPVKHGLGVMNRILVMISERRPLFFFGIIGSMFILAGLVMGVLVVRVLQAQQVLQTGSALVSMLMITIGTLSISTGFILSVLARRLEK